MMKIWLDSSPLPAVQSNSDERDSWDCDCDCGDCNVSGYPLPPYTLSAGRLLLQEAPFTNLASRPLQHAPTLHIQACGEMTWLACNPVGPGTVLVLDAAALALLERFRSPTTLTDLFPDLQDASTRHLREAALLFVQTGLLHDISHPAPEKQERAPQILQGWLHMTNACNLSCSYCYVQKSQEAMSDETARKAIAALVRSAVRQGFAGLRLKYAGGEASLNWRQILATQRFARQLTAEHGLTFSAYVITNGVMLPRKMLEQFKEEQIGVTISLDGIGATHDAQRPFASGLGSFKFVDRTISTMLASDFVPHINVTVSQRNLAGIPELMTYVLDRDLPFTLSYYRENDCSQHLPDLQFSDARMIETMRTAFQIIETRLPKRRLLGSLIDKADLRSNHEYTCSAGRSYLVVDQQGGIARCHTEIQRTVTSIEADDPLRVIQNERSDFLNLPVDQKEGCRTCTWRYWCTGGCPLVTYRTTGRSDIRSPNCQIYQALFPDALRLEALRLLKYESPVIL